MSVRSWLLVCVLLYCPVAFAAEPQEEATPSLLRSWIDFQPWLEKRGLGFAAVLTTDWVSNLHGGRRQRTGALHHLSLTATFDPEKSDWWKHGQFLLNGIGDYGANPSAYIGDLQVTSSLETSDALRLFQAWYEHHFFDETLSLRFGIYDYDAEFYVLDYAALFVNSSFGTGPEVAQTGPAIFPMSALAIRLKYQPTKHLYAMTTVYDGIPGDSGKPRRTAIILREDDGIFYGLEVGLTSATDEPAARHYKVALGGWYHDTEFDDFDGRRRTHNKGMYVLGEVALWREQDPGQGLGVFAQLGFADGDRNPTGVYVGAGVTYTGLFPKRDHDVAGIALAHARNSDALQHSLPAGSPRAESAIELTYRAEVLPWLVVQPDLQFVINPGTNPALDDAVVFTVRLEVTL